MVHWCPCCCIGPCVVIAGPHFDPAVVPGSWSSVTAAIASSLSLASGQEWEATPGNSYWRDGDFSWMFDVVWWFLRLFCYGFECSVSTQILPQQECVLKMEAATLMLRYVAAYVAQFCPCAGRRLCVRNWKKGPSTWVCAQRSLKLADGWCWWLWGLQATDFSSVQTIWNYSRGGSKLAIFNLEGWYQATYNCQNLGGVCP